MKMESNSDITYTDLETSDTLLSFTWFGEYNSDNNKKVICNMYMYVIFVCAFS